MRVALIHDHLAQEGGAEKVLKVFTDMFPDAPIYTLLYEDSVIEKNFKGKRIESSIIQRLPGGVKHYKWYMPFMPMAVEFFDLSKFDLVLSDASAFAKGVITRPETLHICYCHTPTRYVWSDTHSYINELKYNKYFKKIISLVLNYIRMWDRVAADRVDVYVANSKFIAKRITKYYRRDSTVIYPPVDLKIYNISEKIGDYFLIGGRFVPYKRYDIVISAINKLGLKLKVFGDGPDNERLRAIAANNKNIEFLGKVSDPEKAELYSKCLAFINPQEEDFGITPIESMACGRPVIAFKRGGCLETVIDGYTGKLFSEQTIESLADIISQFDQSKFSPDEIRKHALQFSEENFKRKISEFIKDEFKKFQENS